MYIIKMPKNYKMHTPLFLRMLWTRTEKWSNSPTHIFALAIVTGEWVASRLRRFVPGETASAQIPTVCSLRLGHFRDDMVTHLA